MGFTFLVLSDSHGNVPALTAALNWANSDGITSDSRARLQAALFLGDGADDLGPAGTRAGFTLPWYTVRGNGDMRFSIPETLVLPAEQFGRGIFLAHGNHHGIEAGHERLAEAAKAAGAGIAIFGHTHVPCLEYVNAGPAGFTEKILLLNPGSIGRPRSRIGASFAVLEIPDPISNEAARPRVQFWGLSETRKGYAVRKIDF